MPTGQLIHLSIRNPAKQISSFVEEGGLDGQDKELEEVTSVEPISDDPNQHPLNISKFKIKFLKDRPGAVKEITKSLVDSGFICRFYWDSQSVNISPLGESDDRSPQLVLTKIDDTMVEMDLSAEMLDFCQKMEQMGIGEGLHLPGTSCEETVCVYITKVGTAVKLVGLKGDMATLNKAFEGSMNKTPAVKTDDQESKEKVLTMTKSRYDFLMDYKRKCINEKIKQINGVHFEAGENTLKLVGVSPGFEEALEFIEEMIKSVVTLELFVGRGLNVATVAEVALKMIERHQCPVIYQDNLLKKGTTSYSRNQTRKLTVTGCKETKLTVVVNSIEKQKAHIIVNTTNKELDLSQGRGVSWCILKSAGPSIQEELKTKYPKGIQHGEVAESGPGNIKTCDVIYHGALPEFPRGAASQTGEEDCYKWLISLVFNCLITATTATKGFETIAFPALGTGFLDYPVQQVVQLMFRALKIYNHQQLSRRLREVFIVIFPDTKLDVKQLFFAQKQTQRLETRPLESIKQMHDEKRETDGRRTNYEVKVLIGDTLMQVVHADIQKACDVTDAVLVLWSDGDIKKADIHPGLKCTQPAKADWKCSSFVSEISETKCAADSSNLPGRTLMHAYCKDNSNKSITEAITHGLKTADRLGCKTFTITLPTDGHLVAKPGASAQIIIKGVKEAQSKVFVVTVVIEEETIFTAFVDKIEKLKEKLLTPVSVDKTPLANELWEGKFCVKTLKRSGYAKSLVYETTDDSVLLITSDSRDKNNIVADDIKRLLNLSLLQTVEEEPGV